MTHLDTAADALEEGVVTALHAEGLLRSARPAFSHRLRRIAASAALVGTGFAGGLWGPALVATPTEGQDYMLLLHSDASYQAEAVPGSRAREYGAWVREVSARKGADIIAASELADTSWLYGKYAQSTAEPLQTSSLGKTVGYFLIRVRSDAEAKAIAASNPHLAYGGSVSLTRTE